MSLRRKSLDELSHSSPPIDSAEGSDSVSPPADEQEPSVVAPEWLPTITKWYDMDNYGCPKCPFDSLDADVIAQHIYLAHIMPAAQGFHEKE